MQTTKQRRGVTSVEFAVVAPILFLFVFSAIEFNRMNMIRHTANNAAYEAARRSMVPGGTSGEATDFANRMLATLGIKNSTVAISPDPIEESTALVNVTVSVPLNENAWFSRFGRDKTIVSSCTLMTERTGALQAEALTLPSEDPSLPGEADDPKGGKPPLL